MKDGCPASHPFDFAQGRLLKISSQWSVVSDVSPTLSQKTRKDGAPSVVVMRARSRFLPSTALTAGSLRSSE